MFLPFDLSIASVVDPSAVELYVYTLCNPRFVHG